MLSCAPYSILFMSEKDHDLSIQGGRIAYAIEKAGLDVVVVARELNCTRPAVDQWIAGTTKNLKSEFLFGLEDLTGFSARWIATGVGPMVARPSSSLETILESAPSEVVRQTLDFIGYQLAKAGATAEAQEKIATYAARLDATRRDQQPGNKKKEPEWLPDPDATSMNKVTEGKK